MHKKGEEEVKTEVQEVSLRTLIYSTGRQTLAYFQIVLVNQYLMNTATPVH